MISAIVTAAGKNRRMRADLKARGIEIQHKLLLDFQEKPIILQTLQNTLNAGVDECIVVLGHFSDEMTSVIDEIGDERVKIVINPENNVELSESLLNGLKRSENDYCLCVAGDQPTVSTTTLNSIIKGLLDSENPENTISILARGKSGYLNTVDGIGMPFASCSSILKKYLTGNKDNLNPILREMIRNGVIFYGVPPKNDLELVNINTYDDYLKVLKKSVFD